MVDIYQLLFTYQFQQTLMKKKVTCKTKDLCISLTVLLITVDYQTFITIMRHKQVNGN